MLHDIIARTADQLMLDIEIEVSVSITDLSPLHDMCARLVSHRLGPDAEAQDRTRDYREGMIQLAAEHLARRACSALGILTVTAAVDETRTQLMVPELSALIRQALLNWVCRDRLDIDAACRLVSGSEPWRGWPSD